MKNQAIKWFGLVAYLAAFVVLMAGVYAKASSPQEAIVIIIASSVVFLPNVWALMRVSSNKKE